MRPTATPETDRTAEISPPLRHVAAWRVSSVEALPDRRLRVEFVDGTKGEVELKSFLTEDRVRGTIFEPLRESDFFSRVAVIRGAVEWPNGAELAPDAMYDAIQRSGRWVVS